MKKIAVGIEYDGSNYCGWQRQAHSPSIQQHLEQALSYVADHPVELFCAGRTDTAVHACQQVAHFETTAERSSRSWMLGTNCRLPKDIRILWAQPAAVDFHARFSAIARSYRYIILNDERPSAIFHDRVSWQHRALDHAKMHAASQLLLGEHDFSAFRASGCQAKSPLRRIESVSVRRRGKLIDIDIKANAFLHHMVRNISGSLMVIGRGEADIDWLQEVLLSRDRRLAGVTAPAQGLYFIQPFYPAQFAIPGVPRMPLLFD